MASEYYDKLKAATKKALEPKQVDVAGKLAKLDGIKPSVIPSRHAAVNQFGARQQRLKDENMDHFINGSALSGLRRKSRKTTRPEPSLNDLTNDKYDISPINATRIEKETHLRTMQEKVIWETDFSAIVTQLNTGGAGVALARDVTVSYDGNGSALFTVPANVTGTLSAYTFNIPSHRIGMEVIFNIPIADMADVEYLEFEAYIDAAGTSRVNPVLRWTNATDTLIVTDAGAVTTLPRVWTPYSNYWCRWKMVIDTQNYNIDSLYYGSVDGAPTPIPIQNIYNSATPNLDAISVRFSCDSVFALASSVNIGKMVITDEGESI